MTIQQMASVIYNDVVGGLGGISANHNMSLEQLEDEIVIERLAVIKDFILKGVFPLKDLLLTLFRLEVDCKSLDHVPCKGGLLKPSLHFEIPQLLNDLNEESVEYIGTIDKATPFKVYTSAAFTTHRFLKRGGNSPYVYIHPTPNGNNMYDGWIFNMPLIKYITVTAVFKDPRQLIGFDCCDEDNSNVSFIENEIIRRLIEKKIRRYGQAIALLTPNNQAPR